LELNSNQLLCVIAISDQESIFLIVSSLSKQNFSTNIQYMTLPCFIHCIINSICNKKKQFPSFVEIKKSVQRVILYSPEHRLASRPEKRGTIIESLCTKVETVQTQNVTAGSRFEV